MLHHLLHTPARNRNGYANKFKIDSFQSEKRPSKHIILKIYNLSLYLLGAVSPVKSVLRLTEGKIAWTYIGNHNSVAWTSKRVLEELSEFGISVGDMLLPLNQSIDATTEGKEGTVDVCSLD